MLKQIDYNKKIFEELVIYFYILQSKKKSLQFFIQALDKHGLTLHKITSIMRIDLVKNHRATQILVKQANYVAISRTSVTKEQYIKIMQCLCSLTKDMTLGFCYKNRILRFSNLLHGISENEYNYNVFLSLINKFF